MTMTTGTSDSETLKDFVLRNRDLPKEEALRRVLELPKVSSWIQGDEGRRERLTREFERLWAEVVAPPAAPEVPRPHLGPAAGRADARAVREAERPAPRVLRSRREKFICTNCGGYDIHSESDGSTVRVRCRSCKVEFPDLLRLIPVVEVGPFELFFGRGREAWIKAGAIVLCWALAWALLEALA